MFSDHLIHLIQRCENKNELNVPKVPFHDWLCITLLCMHIVLRKIVLSFIIILSADVVDIMWFDVNSIDFLYHKCRRSSQW